MHYIGVDKETFGVENFVTMNVYRSLKDRFEVGKYW